MMTRIYAWAFETKEELDSHVNAYEEAQARDHKKLGRELDIYHIDQTIGKGLPLWLPKGTVIGMSSSVMPRTSSLPMAMSRSPRRPGKG